MAVFQCKMCGAALHLQGEEKIIECEFCGTQQTLPRLGDEARENLYDRANHFRRNNDYDKATAIYEQILNEDTTDAEAYWSILLCRYGIEYVQDPATKKRVPTINRMQYTSILADEDYKSALQYADISQKKLYENEAKAIDKIQKGILAISQAEEPFDVFICYKETDNNGRRTPDSVLAQELYYGLKDEGFKVFFARITLEDKLGSAYEPYIFAALNSAKAMVVLGTQPEHFKAVWVKNEWSRYLSLIKQGEKKVLIPAYKGMDPYDLPDEFSHLQAQDMSKLGFMQDLIRGIKKIVNAAKKKETPQVVVQQTTAPTGAVSALLTRMQMSIEDGEFDQVDRFAEQILNQDPTNAQAYLGKLMAEFKLRRKEDLGALADNLKNSVNYNRLCRFGDKKLIEAIQGYAKAYQEKQRQAQLESAYQDACSLMKKHEYEAAADRFANISEYRDSAVLKEECKQKALLKHKETKYNTAKGLMESGNIEQVKHSKSIFESIKDYKDSLQKSRECDKIIEQLIVLQKQKEKRRKMITMVGFIAVAAVFLIAIISMIVPEVVEDNKAKVIKEAYKTASILAAEGKYAEAYETLKEVDEEDENIAQAYYAMTQGKYGEACKLGLTDIVIPAGTTKIDDKEFEGCKQLLSIKIADSVTSLGNYVFSGCSNLMEIDIPNCVTSIGDGMFYDCSSLMEINIPDSITSISEFAFRGCNNLTEIIIPDGVNSIGAYAFRGCSSLTSVTFGKNSQLTSIGEQVFSGCESLIKIEIPNSVTSVGNNAFSYCENLTTVVLSNKITRIGVSAFDGCRDLIFINIPNSVTSIGEYAFYNCSSLTEIIIPDSVTSIGNYAFKNCSSLPKIVIPNSVKIIGYDAFSSCNKLTIYCEAESKLTGWSDYWNSSDTPVVWGYKGE